jgi:hypothetical protein
MGDETQVGRVGLDEARVQDAEERLRGGRYEVVDLDDPPEFGELAEVVLRSLDGGELPVPGMEVMVPDAADLSLLRGVPVEQVRAITLDGSRWISIYRPSLSIPPGQGKVLSAFVSEAKGLSKDAAITVGVGQIVAFTSNPAPTGF